jgi:hypothetical protein
MNDHDKAIEMAQKLTGSTDNRDSYGGEIHLYGRGITVMYRSHWSDWVIWYRPNQLEGDVIGNDQIFINFVALALLAGLRYSHSQLPTHRSKSKTV